MLYLLNIGFVPDKIAEELSKILGSVHYRGFQGVNLENGKPLDEILKTNDISELDIVGIAEDHCVRTIAIGGLDLGYNVRVFKDLTMPVTSGSNALEEVSNKGGIVIYSTT